MLAECLHPCEFLSKPEFSSSCCLLTSWCFQRAFQDIFLSFSESDLSWEHETLLAKSKEFLVTSPNTQQHHHWDIWKNQRELNNYHCTKAEYIENSLRKEVKLSRRINAFNVSETSILLFKPLPSEYLDRRCKCCWGWKNKLSIIK